MTWCLPLLSDRCCFHVDLKLIHPPGAICSLSSKVNAISERSNPSFPLDTWFCGIKIRDEEGSGLSQLQGRPILYAAIGWNSYKIFVKLPNKSALVTERSRLRHRSKVIEHNLTPLMLTGCLSGRKLNKVGRAGNLTA